MLLCLQSRAIIFNDLVLYGTIKLSMITSFSSKQTQFSIPKESGIQHRLLLGFWTLSAV